MKKVLISLLVAIALCTSIALAAPPANPTVRVGLYFDTTALATANLQNKVGAGYRVGFFDSQGNFISLWQLQDQKITMAKEKNLYFAEGTFYESGAPAGSRVLGAYHVQLDAAYPNAQLAESAAAQMKAQGIGAFVCYLNGAYRVRIGSFSTLAEASAATVQYASLGTASAVGDGNTCITIYNTESGAILFAFDGGPATALAISPSLGEAAAPITWFKGYQYYGAFEYRRNGGNITVINRLTMQDYVKGVVPYEMSASWPVEALKAQAMCARTYAYSNFNKHGADFDICAGTHCQAYQGVSKASENSDRAVDETLGQYILYNGELIDAVYHSSDGGATEDAENVWGYATPYLRGVEDTYEDLDSAINGRWSFSYTPAELTSILNAKGYDAALIADAYVEEFTRMGNVRKVTFVDVNGKKFSFEKEKARTIINSSTLKKYTYSQRYKIIRAGAAAGGGGTESFLYVNDGSATVDLNSGSISVITGSGAIGMLIGPDVVIQTAQGKETVSAGSGGQGSVEASSGSSGDFVFTGTGWGHNVGMSQNGALGMAKQGFTAEQIIHFYYTGVTITGE